MAFWLGPALTLLAFSGVGLAQEKDPQDLLQLGLDAYQSGDLQKARDIWEEGLRLAEQHKDDLFLGSFHGNLGIIDSITGQHAEAIEHFERSLDLARAAGDRQGLKNRLNNVGGLYLLMRQPDKALERFSEALTIARTLGDHSLEVAVLNNLGETYLLTGDNAAALEQLRQASQAPAAVSRPELHVKIVSNLGQAHAAMGNYPQALSHFRMAISVAQKGEDGREKTASLLRDYNRMGILARDMGDPLGAVALHQAALEQAKAANSDQEEQASQDLLAMSRAQIDGSPETLHRLRIEGLNRMLSRLRAHNLQALAQQVEAQIHRLEQSPSDTAKTP